MDFLKIAYVKGGHWVCFSSSPFSCPSPAFSCHSSRFSCSSSPFSLLLFSPSFHGLPSVPFSRVLHSFFRSVYYLPTLITFSCPSFLSSILFSFLPFYYHSVRPSYVSFSFDNFFLYLLIFHVINII